MLLSAGLADEALQTVAAAVAELSQGGQAADLAEAQLLLARAQLSAAAPGPASESAAAARARLHPPARRPRWAAAALYVEVHAFWAAGERHRAAAVRAERGAGRLDGVEMVHRGTGHAAAGRADRHRPRAARGREDQLRAAARARHSAQLERRARAWHALALLRVQAGDRRGADAAVSAGPDRGRAGSGAARRDRASGAGRRSGGGARRARRILAVAEGTAERVLQLRRAVPGRHAADPASAAAAG